MKLAPLAALLAFLASPAAAADAPRGGISTKFIGEDGGYKQPDPMTGQYLEDAARQGDPSAPSIAPAPLPPAAAVPPAVR